jgi:SAM-dependent methyltransferase
VTRAPGEGPGQAAPPARREPARAEAAPARPPGPDPARGGRREFWSARTVAWYARALARSDYAARVLEVLGPRLGGCGDALDVGAGCGALALPLARRLTGVTALEPAPAMAAALRAGAREAGLGNITVIEAAWGETTLGAHDVVLCAHVGGLMRGDSPFLREVGRLARRLVVLVRDVRTVPEPDKFFYRELYPALLGRPYRQRRDGDETLAGLRELGVVPETAVISYSSDQPFADLDEACEFFMTYLGLEGPAPRAYLARFLSERLTRRDGELIAPFTKTAVVITWTTA